MIDSNYIDTGKDMTYCEVHKYWYPVEECCEGCERIKVVKCVRNDKINLIENDGVGCV